MCHSQPGDPESPGPAEADGGTEKRGFSSKRTPPLSKSRPPLTPGNDLAVPAGSRTRRAEKAGGLTRPPQLVGPYRIDVSMANAFMMNYSDAYKLAPILL